MISLLQWNFLASVNKIERHIHVSRQFIGGTIGLDDTVATKRQWLCVIGYNHTSLPMRDGSSGPNQGRNASPPITEATGAIKLPAHSNTMLSYSAFGEQGRKQREITEGKSGGRRGEKELKVGKNFCHHFIISN